MTPSTSAVNVLPPSPPVVDQDGALINTQMYDQLGELARFIDTTLKTITKFRDPMSATTEQLPEAVTHLRDLKKLTEDGSHKIMQLVESIQDNHQRLAKELDEVGKAIAATPGLEKAASTIGTLRTGLLANDKPLVNIITALSFQDLVAQRVNKLVTIIDEVEHKLLELVVIFGPYTKGAGAAEVSKTAEMLKQLEASKSTAMNQDLADDILKQFGFN